VVHVRSGRHADGPRDETVEPAKQLAGTWPVTAVGATEYDHSVYGPNGFLRAFKGGVAQGRAMLAVRAKYALSRPELIVSIANRGTSAARVSIRDGYTHTRLVRTLLPKETIVERWDLRNVYGWYDLAVTVASDTGFEYRLAGHVENGEDSISDPRVGRML
jgi:phospholipase C